MKLYIATGENGSGAETYEGVFTSHEEAHKRSHTVYEIDTETIDKNPVDINGQIQLRGFRGEQ